MARSFYRIVKTDPPSEVDFAPRPLRQNIQLDPRLQELASGISVWATLPQARRAAREFPRLGSHIARVETPEDAIVRTEKTLGPGHYTIWGDARILQSLVIETVPVEG